MTNLDQYLVIGQKTEIGSHRFDRDEIIRFAANYDPQSFHLDETAAEKSLFGALCASGWHTCAVWMKQNRDFTEHLVARYNNDNATDIEIGPSPGFENLKWLKPVFVDQTITFFNTPRSLRQSRSRTGWWIQTLDHEGANEAGDLVISFTSSVFIYGLSQIRQNME